MNSIRRDEERGHSGLETQEYSTERAHSPDTSESGFPDLRMSVGIFQGLA